MTFDDELAYLRGEGPDPFDKPEVERWKSRAETAEQWRDQAGNTIRSLSDLYTLNPVVCFVLSVLLTDLGL